MTTPTTPRRWARVRERDGRVLVSFYVKDRAEFLAVKEDLRATFRRHRDCIWAGTFQAWSLPAHHRQRVEEWLACWFAPEQVRWTHAAPLDTKPHTVKETGS